MSTISAASWPPADWSVDDCFAWLGQCGAELGKGFSASEARDAVGRWVAGGGAGKAARRKGAIALAARSEAQRARTLPAKRTLHGEAHTVDGHAVHAADDGQSEDSFEKDLAGARHADQKQGKVALQAWVDEDDDNESIKEKLMDSYDSDRRNKPGWLSGRAAVEDRKHVENAVDDYLAAGNTDDGFQEGEVLHVSIPRPADSRFHSAAEAHAKHLKSQGMKDSDIAKEISGEADEARDAAKLKSVGEQAATAEKDRYAALKAAYPKEFEEAMTSGNKGFKLFQLGNRYEREHGKKLPY